MESEFTVNTKELLSILHQMNKIGPAFRSDTCLKIAVLPNLIELSRQGMSKNISAQTKGLADIVVPALMMFGFAKTMKGDSICFKISDGQLQCRNVILSSRHIKLETLFNIPENPLPVNATKIQLLRQFRCWTNDEIDRLGLRSVVDKEHALLDDRILKAVTLLKDYEVSFSDLLKVILDKTKP
ncbi:MAG: hypothetical protein JST52_00105 [Bacteroidetes bacterium]|nr:hypothetical protein [Bacteroidota bacterium]MBS1739640.1 hypothetical protein [Bacteroidota bacterium]